MSIEEAREAIHEHCDLAHFAYLNPGMDAALKHQEEAIDRLILEVQAEMPCSGCGDVAGQHTGGCDCFDYDGKLASEWEPCPSCTARMKLKETADAR